MIDDFLERLPMTFKHSNMPTYCYKTESNSWIHFPRGGFPKNAKPVV